MVGLDNSRLVFYPRDVSIPVPDHRWPILGTLHREEAAVKVCVVWHGKSR